MTKSMRTNQKVEYITVCLDDWFATGLPPGMVKMMAE